MRFSLRPAILLACFLTPGVFQGQSTPTLLVLSKHDHTLSIVDPATLKVTGKVAVGNDPHEVIASADGSTAYVTNYGFGAYNTLAVVDLAGRRALPAIDLGPLRGPHGLVFVDGKVWFTAEAAKAIARYDPVSHKVDWIMGTGQNRTHMIYVSPDAERIVNTNVSSGTVSIFEQEPVRMPPPPPGMGGPPPGGPGSSRPRTDWNQTVVRVGNGSEGFDVSPDGKEIWVANAQDGTLSVIDFAQKKVVETLQSETRGANRLRFTRDGKTVLVSSGPDLVVLDAHTRKVVKRIAIGHGSGGLLVEPDGRRAFVSCGPDSYVAVIDLHTLAVTGHIDAGGEPDGLAWAVRK